MKQLDLRYRKNYRTSLIENLKQIQRLGIEDFIKCEEEKWTCSLCGKTMSIHREFCLNCKTNVRIETATTKDYPKIMKVWDSSVKATHHFLKPKDFEYYKQMGPRKYLPAVNLYVLRIEETITGFIGVSGNHLEMLFIDPDFRGNGHGKILLNYAIEHLGITTLDVNEQNDQALGFYKKMGFSIAGRSEKDAEGKNYPILHLELNR